MTVIECTRVVQVRLAWSMNGFERPDFLETAWSQAEGSSILWCPCNSCGNKKQRTKKVMGQHLCKYKFTPDYIRWTFHSEAHRMREEVVRQYIDDCSNEWISSLYKASPSIIWSCWSCEVSPVKQTVVTGLADALCLFDITANNGYEWISSLYKASPWTVRSHILIDNLCMLNWLV